MRACAILLVIDHIDSIYSTTTVVDSIMHSRLAAAMPYYYRRHPSTLQYSAVDCYRGGLPDGIRVLAS